MFIRLQMVVVWLIDVNHWLVLMNDDSMMVNDH